MRKWLAPLLSQRGPSVPQSLETLRVVLLSPPPGSFQEAGMMVSRRWGRVLSTSRRLWLFWQDEALPAPSGAGRLVDFSTLGGWGGPTAPRLWPEPSPAPHPTAHLGSHSPDPKALSPVGFKFGPAAPDADPGTEPGGRVFPRAWPWACPLLLPVLPRGSRPGWER